jgi:three-Cys-motif partner protein
MAEPTLWDREAHTAAKHRVLRAYVDGWIPVMAQQALRVQHMNLGSPRLLLVDGFAGPGRYRTGEDGSPLIMLKALLEHSGLDRWNDVTFIFLFIEQDERRFEHLEQELRALEPFPRNVSVHPRHGDFATTFGAIVDSPRQRGMHLVPTFAFIDPFGYAQASMSLTGRLLDFPRCETLFFLPLSYVHRFVGRQGQDQAMTSLFGSADWRQAIPLDGDERKAFLLELFERQLSGHRSVEHVRSFQLRTQDGMDYRLVFGLGHEKGLELAKDAMWKVDPIAGTSYTATTSSGQQVLFSPTDVDTTPLLCEFQQKFGGDWFTPDEARRCALFDTPYRVGHVKQKTLAPARQSGALEVDPPGARGFTSGVRLRFRS